MYRYSDLFPKFLKQESEILISSYMGPKLRVRFYVALQINFKLHGSKAPCWVFGPLSKIQCLSGHNGLCEFVWNKGLNKSFGVNGTFPFRLLPYDALAESMPFRWLPYDGLADLMY
jgi:hypothetical protein